MLNWNEIRIRAAGFAKEWENASYEKGETQSFYNDFFEVFGVKRRKVGFYERQVKNLNNQTGFIDLFWPGKLLVEQKSAGRNLEQALKQAHSYCPNLSEEEFPRYILVSDFQTFQLFDLDERHESHFSLADFPDHVQKFGFIRGVEKRVFRDQDPVNIRASEIIGRVHDALEDAGYQGHDLEQFLVRLVFCLFADNTGIFDPHIFLNLLEDRTAQDGSDVGIWLAQLFQVLNTPEDERQKTLDEDLNKFPYVNGDLFEQSLRIPSFNSAMRQSLIAAANFDWSPISPAIFGALFQSVMDKEQRRKQGAHYTTEKNIMKVIQPLFLDELRAEFKKIKKLKTDRKKRLQTFHEKLGRLKFFDPACGCGNFLIITYYALRRLEIDMLKEIYPTDSPQMDVHTLSKIDVDQFYGIELGEFPARIAETALWMMDHIMNNELSLAFGRSYLRIPLKKSPHIICADALEMDWETHLPAGECDYILGNPPFGGAKFQSKEQREQTHRIAGLGGSGGTLDYVASWFLKAGAYVQKSKAKISFVATNSITQGEQVGQLWPILFDRYKLEIAFAHRTFAWGSDARGMAHVHVVIIGLTRADAELKEKRLFSYPDIKGEPEESRHAALSPYLFSADKATNRHLMVKEEARPINNLPQMIIGSQPIDGGYYIFTQSEKEVFLEKEPKAEKFLHPFIGAKEYLQGNTRWILSLQKAAPSELDALPEIKKRIATVRKFRSKSRRTSTLKLAETPTKYQVNTIPDAPFLLIPRVSSERREYAPIGWYKPPTIPSDATTCMMNATLDIFALLSSSMHMAWLRHTGGRLKSDYRYSVGIVYNTFPMPQMTERQKDNISRLAQDVLDARAAHPTSNLAALYDPDLMPPNLRQAHQKLDKAVDRLYSKTPFTSERERIEHLFGLYEKMTQPLTSPKKRRRTRY